MRKLFLYFIIIMVFIFNNLTCFAQLDKWINDEVIPTIRGERPLEIKPYIRVSHDGKKIFEVGQDKLFIKIGDVSIKTHQLRYRLLQAGCIIETGDIIKCAPDILEREILKIANADILDGSIYNKKNPFKGCIDCLWKPKIFNDDRLGPIIVNNLSTVDIKVIVWHPDTFLPLHTWIVPPNKQQVLKIDNNIFYAGADWGIEVEFGTSGICTLGEVSSWTRFKDGFYWCFFIKSCGYLW